MCCCECMCCCVYVLLCVCVLLCASLLKCGLPTCSIVNENVFFCVFLPPTDALVCGVIITAGICCMLRLCYRCFSCIVLCFSIALVCF